MKFTFVAVSVPAMKEVLAFKERYDRDYPGNNLEISCFYIAASEHRYLLDPEPLIEAVSSADVAVIDTMGASEEFQEIVRKGLEQCRGHRIIIGNALREYITLGSFSMSKMGKMMEKKEEPETQLEKEKETSGKDKSAIVKMHKMRRMALMIGHILPFGITKDMKNVFTLVDYWQQATETDITSFMHLILRQYMGKKKLPKEKPCTMEYGIYLKNPDTLETTDSQEEYWKHAGYDKEKKTVALLFYGHSYPNDFMPVVKSVKKCLEKNFNLLPVAFSQNEDKDLDKLEQYLSDKKRPVSAVINFMPFRLGAGPMGGDAERAVEILKKINVPYLNPFSLTKVTEEEWEEAGAVNPGEFLISILLPELDGGILTFPIGVMDKGTEGKHGLSLPALKPLDERIHMLTERLENLICLREKKNSEKKIAIVFYNYPPGESNVFGGAFLDTFFSASSLLSSLKEAGYNAEEKTPEELMQAFIYEGRCNSPQWQDENDQKIKGILAGNIFLGVQPVKDSDYHDRNSIPEEDYRDFYQYIRDDFKADAVLHFGTHGTLEFLQGKDNGMTEKCWPDRLISAVPHFYYYYVGNPSEAMIAKRRTHATLISYEAPPFEKSGLYGKYEELKEIIAEYRESQQTSPERCNDLLVNIGKLSSECGFSELEITEKELDEIDEKLYSYENSLITDGLHQINKEETEGILRALHGEYIQAGPGGDVIKNPDILPSGRNIVQFDPRLIPTRTACERGAEAAKQTVEKYRREKGNYPDTTAVILWGLETSRSQGETIGQIMYYLGLRLKTEKSSFDDRFEIIPAVELGRPRMDVIIHICGFFRDMYPNIIDNLNEMMQRILALDESPEQNFYKANTMKLAETEDMEMASCRIFGPEEGEYGTRLTDVVRKGTWKDPSEIGAFFTDDLSYGYSYHHRGTDGKNILKKQYEKVDFISQIRNNAEYELTDLDHYYEFYGGLSKAVENIKGEKPVMLIADTTGEAVKTESIEESLSRGIATKILNPKWIEGMMKHDYHGVQQIEKRFENVMGFAATTDAVKSSTFSEMTKCYAGNEELRRKMQESNRFAYMKMMERLMEAKNRGYFDATEEELEQIQEAYLEAEGEAED